MNFHISTYCTVHHTQDPSLFPLPGKFGF
jgi:hypothetical protein